MWHFPDVEATLDAMFTFSFLFSSYSRLTSVSCLQTKKIWQPKAFDSKEFLFSSTLNDPMSQFDANMYSSVIKFFWFEKHLSEETLDVILVFTTMSHSKFCQQYCDYSFKFTQNPVLFIYTQFYKHVCKNIIQCWFLS